MIIANNTLVHGIKSSQSLLATVMRGGLGIMGTAKPLQPPKSLILYEFEACPFCRRVREVMTHLNLDFESRPSPHAGHVYRDDLKQKSGKTQVPFLVDENTGISLSESQDIIDYLFEHYSKEGQTPKKFQRGKTVGGVGIFNSSASLMCMMRGMKAKQAQKNHTRGKPSVPLELYGFEASPFCRLVRERLSELEVGFINRNVAREQLQDIGLPNLRPTIGEYKPVKGGKRERIMNEVMGGKIQVPYLIDPNTTTKMFESKDIIHYLDKTYG